LDWLRSAAPLRENARWVLDELLCELRRLANELKKVECRLAEVTQDSPFVQFLMSQRGIGLITAVTMLAELGRVDRFCSAKQLSRFCGLSPRNASSGNRQADAGLIKASNPELRRVLIEAGHRLMRLDERWHAFREQMRSRGKPHGVIVAATANRWLRQMYHPLKALAG
jgi:transposase